MTDIRNFRNYIEELSGNNLLKKKIKVLEKRNKKIEIILDEAKEDIKAIKKNMLKPIPKPKGRKPRSMIRMIEDEMAKQPNKTIKVTDLVKKLKRKRVKSKAQNLYSSIAASLANSPKFTKVGPGTYKLAVEKKPAPKKTTKKK